MPSVAQWTGSPAIRGSSESVRMALLTASLVGLQYAQLHPIQHKLTLAGSPGMLK